MDTALVISEHQVLDGKRIKLRPVTLEDAADMFEYASDAEVVQFVFEPHQSVAETRRRIAEYFMNDPLGKYAIELKAEQKMIGTIDLRVQAEHKIAELGYTLNRQYWGNGYMTEAGNLLICLAFEKLELNKVFALHDYDNPASGKVMQRLGMQKEGVLRHNRIHKGKVCDMIHYGLLKEEYRQKRAE